MNSRPDIIAIVVGCIAASLSALLIGVDSWAYRWPIVGLAGLALSMFGVGINAFNLGRSGR